MIERRERYSRYQELNRSIDKNKVRLAILELLEYMDVIKLRQLRCDHLGPK